MSERFDIAVIGCGVVGLAILRRFAMAGLKCAALEKGADILSGASKGNSALLHTGFDAPPKSLELQCMQAGYAEYLEIRQKLNLPLLETSALVVAWKEDELSKLDGIEKKARINGVSDVKRLTQTELRIREPQLAKIALGAILVPGEHVIDPWSVPLAYAHQAIAHGVEIFRNSEVTKTERQGDEWRLTTPHGDVVARTVINAAGLYGDHVEALARESDFKIKPRKGQFVCLTSPHPNYCVPLSCLCPRSAPKAWFCSAPSSAISRSGPRLKIPMSARMPPLTRLRWKSLKPLPSICCLR